MAAILYNWLLIFSLGVFPTQHHPIFVSVTNIEHNAASKTLEISCKIFTDDLEIAIRKKYNTKVDLLDVKLTPVMNKLVNDYIQNHLSIKADNNLVQLNFIGFEQQEEGIISYFEVKNISRLNKIDVVNNILYDEKPQQMEIIHVTVKGERKSSRLNNPDATASFVF